MNTLRILEELDDGKIFSVLFIKKTTGEKRQMLARRGVKSARHGGELKYDPVARGLFPVFDVEKEGYRMIPVENIIEIHHHGKVERGPLYEEQAA